MSRTPKIPADEMLLAEAIAAAKARGLRWTTTRPFRNDQLRACDPEQAASCCAMGALYLAGCVSRTATFVGSGLCREEDVPHGLYDVWRGNDRGDEWSGFADDRGESLGWAFRQAMTDGDS